MNKIYISWLSNSSTHQHISEEQKKWINYFFSLVFNQCYEIHYNILTPNPHIVVLGGIDPWKSPLFSKLQDAFVFKIYFDHPETKKEDELRYIKDFDICFNNKNLPFWIRKLEYQLINNLKIDEFIIKVVLSHNEQPSPENILSNELKNNVSGEYFQIIKEKWYKSLFQHINFIKKFQQFRIDYQNSIYQKQILAAIQLENWDFVEQTIKLITSEKLKDELQIVCCNHKDISISFDVLYKIIYQLENTIVLDDNPKLFSRLENDENDNFVDSSLNQVLSQSIGERSKVKWLNLFWIYLSKINRNDKKEFNDFLSAYINVGKCNINKLIFDYWLPYDTVQEIKVINLKKRPKRWKHMLEVEKQINFKLTRIDAIDGHLDIKSLQNVNIPKNLRSIKSLGQLGCWLTHLREWSLLAKLKNGWKLFLEDDCVPSPFFNRDWSILPFLLYYVNDFHLIWLGYHLTPNMRCHSFQNSSPKQFILTNEHSIQHKIGGTFAYLLNPKGAQMLLEAFNENENIQEGIDTWILSLFNIKQLTIEPSLFYSSYLLENDPDTHQSDCI